MNTVAQYRRKNVLKAASLYLLSSWLLVQIFSVVSPYFHLPVVAGTTLVIALAAGFPVACFMAYFFEVSVWGLKRITKDSLSNTKDDSTEAPVPNSKLPHMNEALMRIHEAIKKIAILPFANLIDDPESNFLGFALADQIIGSMAYSRHVLVRPSSSVRPYQTAACDIQDVGEKLRVHYILAGNYLKDGDKIRLNVELVELSLEKMIWRETIAIEYKDVFELQDVVAQKIAKGLKIQFSDLEKARMNADQPDSSESYDLYLRAVAQPHTIEGHHQAVNLINQALEIDPDYAVLHLELGMRLFSVAQVGNDTEDSHIKAEQALSKALSLNPDSLPALANLGMVYTDDGRHEEAHSMLIKALKINPADAWLHFALSYHYRYIGFLEESKKEMEIALVTDSDNILFRSSIVTYMFLGEYDHILDNFNLGLDSPFSLNYLGEVAYRAGKLDLAVDYFNRVLAIENEIGEYHFAASFIAFIQGDRAKALAFNRDREAEEPADSEIYYEIARIYGLYGEVEDCRRTLKKAIEMGYVSYPSIDGDDFLKAVNQEPVIKNLLNLAQQKHQALRNSLIETY